MAKSKSRDIVLALGGGAARGMAHIGVIRELEKVGVNVRAVAGTSIGSVVGAIYAAGELDAYEKWVRELEWKGVVKMLDPVLLGAGLLGGDRLEKMLANYGGEREIADFRIPYCAVAADLESGAEVHITTGRANDAMRASFAIPGLFTPVRRKNHWLVDGGVACPVPIGAARKLIDDLPVVAVNVNSMRGPMTDSQTVVEDANEIETPRENSKIAPSEEASNGFFENARDTLIRRITRKSSGSPRLLASLSDSLAHLEHRLTEFQLAADQPDVLIEPKLVSVGLFDFYKADALIEEGARAALEVIESGELERALRKGRLLPKLPEWLRGRL